MKRPLFSGMLIAGSLLVAIQWYTGKWPINMANPEKEAEEEKETGIDRQMAMWWWSRGYPDPENINEKYYQAWLHAQAMKEPGISWRTGNNTRENDITLFSGNWSAIGPSQNIGGRVLSVAVHPSNSNIVYIGSASGGIWKTVTGGTGSNAWQPVSTGFPTLGVASIIIDPSNPDIIYAGTGEVYRVDTSNIGFNVWKARGTYGVGILKSTNGGLTWTQVYASNLSNMHGVQMLAFDPSNSNTIYACATDGLYRSTDAGATWTNIFIKTYVSDIAINPSNTNVLVAGVGNLVNPDKGIYRSTNGGATWTKISSGLPSSFSGFIRLDNISSSKLYASIGRNDGGENELYLSTDFGATWITKTGSHHCEYQFWCAHDLAIDPSNDNRVIMGGVSLYSYTSTSNTNGNGSRSTIGSNVHADIHDVAYDPSNNNTVYIACDGGIYKSTNNGSTFSNINGGLQAVQFYASMAVSPTNSNILVGGLQDNGVVMYNGSGWSTLFGGDGGPCMFHPTNGNILFASNDARAVRRSGNGGGSFSSVLSSWAFVADDRTAFMAPIAISKSDPNYVYCASDNLHKSTNGGVSWTNNSYTSATSYIDARYKTGIALAVSPLNRDKLFVSVSPFSQKVNSDLNTNPPANILKSTNGGTTFTGIKGTLPDRFVMDFAFHPANDDSVWIVMGGYGSSHVFVTADGGATWTDKGVGLPDVPHNAILLDPNDPGILYVGNDLGVYMSPDNGATWYDFNNALWDATLVMDLQAMGNTQLVAATHGKGAFISDLYSTQLPVTLISFSGTHQGSYNELKWVTSLEENTLHYEIERSIDGGPYARIATVPALNSSTGASYSWRDPVPNTLAGKTLFYRLKMVDRDGRFTWSNVISLRMPVITGLVIAGNPFSGSIRISLNTRSPQAVSLKLYDAAGKWVAGRSYAAGVGYNMLTMNNLQRLPAGTYMLEIMAGEDRFTRKLVKQ